MATHSLEQLKELYGKLPAEIKEMILADETQENICKILEGHEILDERAGLISNLIRDSLFGFLPPGNFEASLEKEIGLDPDLAKKIALEVNRFVFSPVKESLNLLNKIEAGTEETATTEAIPAETAEKSSKPDTYREPVE